MNKNIKEKTLNDKKKFKNPHITKSKVMVQVKHQTCKVVGRKIHSTEDDKKTDIILRNKTISRILTIKKYYARTYMFANSCDEKFYNNCIHDPVFKKFTHYGDFDAEMLAKTRILAAQIVSDSQIIQPSRVIELMKLSDTKCMFVKNIYEYITDLCNKHNSTIELNIRRIKELRLRLLKTLMLEFNVETINELIGQLLMYSTPQEIFISCYRTYSETLTCRVMLYVSYLTQNNYDITEDHIINALSFDVCEDYPSTILLKCKKNANIFLYINIILSVIWNSECPNVCALIAAYACEII